MFGAWIATEFEMGDQSARRFMHVAEKYAGANPTDLLDLSADALYALAAPSTPQEVRDEVERMLIDGVTVTAADVKRMKAEHAAAQDESGRLGKGASLALLGAEALYAHGDLNPSRPGSVSLTASRVILRGSGAELARCLCYPERMEG